MSLLSANVLKKTGVGAMPMGYRQLSHDLFALC